MKINNYDKLRPTNVYFEGPDDSMGGGNAPADDGNAPADDGAPNNEPPAFDVDALAEKLGGVITKSLPKAPEKQMSKEEAAKLLNVWDPDDTFFTEFNNMETQKQAFLKMRDGMIRQMATIAQAISYQNRQELEQQYSPLQEYYQQQQVEARKGRFEKAYPQLADETMQPVVQSVISALQAKGTEFKDEKSAFTAIAKGVEAVVKRINPDFTLETNGPASSGKTPGNANALRPQTSGAGAGGGGGGSGSGKAQPKGTALKYL